MPGAKRAAVVGRYGAGWKLSVSAPPEKGKANDAVIHLLAETLELPRSSVSIVSGQSGRDKVAVLSGISQQAVIDRLTAAASAPGGGA